MRIKYRAANNYDEKKASDEAVMPHDPVSLTVQAHAEDADLNVLMNRYGITGKFPENPRIPMYGDFEHITDFRSALAAVEAAQQAFMEYPATFRARFDNNPQLFLEWAGRPDSRPEMEKLGMLKPPPAATPSPALPPGEPPKTS